MLFSALNESATTSAPVVAAPATNGVPAASQAFATPGQPNMMTSNTQPQVNDCRGFRQAEDKRRSTFAEVSFWLPILLLFCSCFGATVGALDCLFNCVMATQGLKGKKRGKAIAALVMTLVALLIGIVMLIRSQA